MANDAQETLFRIFAGLAGGSVNGTGSGGWTGGAIGSAISLASGEEDKGGGAAEIALNVLKSGLGVVPLAAALFGLFGGGGDEEKPAPLIKYLLPERREFQAAATGSGFAEVDYDQWGMPRAPERRGREAGMPRAPEWGGQEPRMPRVAESREQEPGMPWLPERGEQEPGMPRVAESREREPGMPWLPERGERERATPVWTASGADRSRISETAGSPAPEQRVASGLPPITVNVQAMDARSFLDRSSEIAAAVREAMLNLNSINDVVTDL